MHARLTRTALCLALALPVAGCGGGGGYTSPTPAGGGPPPAASSEHVISIPVGDGYGNSSFSPGNLTIPVGSTVVWTNRDTVAHTSTSTANAWNATIEPGGSFNRTFSERGAFNYRCTIHAGMSGIVTVQ